MCYNLPLGLWVLYKSKVKGKYIRYSWCWLYTNVYVMWNILYSAANEKGVGRYQIGLALGIKTPQGLSRSLSLQKHTQILSTVNYILPPILLSGNTHTSSTHKYSQLSWFGWKSICLTTTIFPAVQQSQNPRPYSILNPISLHQFSHHYPCPVLMLTFLMRPLLVPTKTSEWFL